MKTQRVFRTILHMGWPFVSKNAVMRKLARQGRLAKLPPIIRPLIWLLATLLWPIGAAIQCRQIRNYIRSKNNQTKDHFPILKAYGMALTDNLPPWDNYIYGLWKDKNSASQYLLSHERVGLMHYLNAPHYSQYDNPIDNKIALAAFCETHQIPHPKLIWHRGKNDPRGQPLETALWLKPVTGSNGVRNRAISSWDDIDFFDPSLLVQAYQSNHPALEQFSNSSLIVLRILSGKSKDEHIHIIAASLHMPFGASQLSHDGLIGRIEQKSGELKSVRFPDKTYRPVLKHPDTHEDFDTLLLPDWSDAIDIVKTAHSHLNGYIFIGWDVAFTPNGPVLIEGNSSWNAEQHQEPAPAPAPLGDTIFRDVIESYL